MLFSLIVSVGAKVLSKTKPTCPETAIPEASGAQRLMQKQAVNIKAGKRFRYFGNLSSFKYVFTVPNRNVTDASCIHAVGLRPEKRLSWKRALVKEQKGVWFHLSLLRPELEYDTQF